MRLTSMLSITALIAAALAAPGCISHDPPPSPSQDVIREYPQIAIEPKADPNLVVGRPVVEPTTLDKPMRVTVPIRNAHYDDTKNYQYRFLFFDNAHRPINPNQGWQYIQLPARMERSLDGAALDTTAVDWRLELRKAY